MYWVLLVLVLGVFGVNEAYAQTIIDVPEISPCFLNNNNSLTLWEECGADEDYIQFALLPWEWITGGYFSMILVTIFVLISYVKYQNVLYPILIGVAFLPVSYTLFPEVFIQYAIALMAVGVISSLIFLVIRQTKEYNN